MSLGMRFEDLARVRAKLGRASAADEAQRRRSSGCRQQDRAVRGARGAHSQGQKERSAFRPDATRENSTVPGLKFRLLASTMYITRSPLPP